MKQIITLILGLYAAILVASAQSYFHYSETKYNYGPYYFKTGVNMLNNAIEYNVQKKREKLTKRKCSNVLTRFVSIILALIATQTESLMGGIKFLL